MAILGKYRILGELGQGGMADVYLASPVDCHEGEKLVVIKRLRNLEAHHIAMFLDEARIARRLSHPNIVRTFDIGQENGSHFLVMEYLHGPTLCPGPSRSTSSAGCSMACTAPTSCGRPTALRCTWSTGISPPRT